MLSASFAQVPTFSAGDLANGISEVSEIAHFYGHGASAADYDNDGDIDFYLSTDNGIRDRLYQNNGQGVFRDVSSETSINVTTASRASIWFDANEDGLLDLLVAGERCVNFSCGQPIILNLFIQLQEHTFENRTQGSGLITGDKYDRLENYALGGLQVGDLDNDGHIDLILSVWGGSLTIFKGLGNGTFTDITQQLGIGTTNNWYWQPMIHDFDGDGRRDVYLNIDFEENELWQNISGNYTEVAQKSGANSAFNEMGVTLGDYDNDGDFDIYSTNITRVHENKTQHNILLINQSEKGNIMFRERARGMGISDNGWDWGCTFFDFNNDGWVDLASTNGWNDPSWHSDQSKMWMNLNGSFSDVSEQSFFNDFLSATTIIAFDMDRDGDLDILQTLKENTNTRMPACIYTNNLDQNSNRGDFITIKPRMRGLNTFAVGSTVRIYTDKKMQSRYMAGATSFYGQEPYEAFFGLGNEKIREVWIEWPDQRVSIFKNLIELESHIVYDDYLDPPTDVRLEIDHDHFNLSWIDNSMNETGYYIQMSNSRNFDDSQQEFYLESNTSDISIPNPDWPNTFFRVQAYNDIVFSNYSPVVSTLDGLTATEELESQFQIFPNPADQYLMLKMNLDFSNLILFDPSGKIISVDYQVINDGLKLNVSSLLPGIYILSLNINGSTVKKKVVIK